MENKIQELADKIHMKLNFSCERGQRNKLIEKNEKKNNHVHASQTHSYIDINFPNTKFVTSQQSFPKQSRVQQIQNIISQKLFKDDNRYLTNNFKSLDLYKKNATEEEQEQSFSHSHNYFKNSGISNPIKPKSGLNQMKKLKEKNVNLQNSVKKLKNKVETIQSALLRMNKSGIKEDMEKNKNREVKIKSMGKSFEKQKSKKQKLNKNGKYYRNMKFSQNLSKNTNMRENIKKNVSKNQNYGFENDEKQRKISKNKGMVSVDTKMNPETSNFLKKESKPTKDNLLKHGKKKREYTFQIVSKQNQSKNRAQIQSSCLLKKQKSNVSLKSLNTKKSNSRW